MPDEQYHFLHHSKLMRPDEILALASIFVELGVRKIRLTGGEPLLRPDFAEIAHKLSVLPVELLLTTNGILLPKYLPTLRTCGITSINISLDTLKADRFAQITKRDRFHEVWDAIQSLLTEGYRLKINVVAVKGAIEDELLDFIELTKTQPLHIRFIEFMPFDGNRWDKTKVLPAGAMLNYVQDHYDTIKLNDGPNDTAKKYQVIGHKGTFAFITTMTDQFCGTCNRLRLTAEGSIKNCLFGKEELSLLDALRNGTDVKALIEASVRGKHQAMGGQFTNGSLDTRVEALVNRSMIQIGG